MSVRSNMICRSLFPTPRFPISKKERRDGCCMLVKKLVYSRTRLDTGESYIARSHPNYQREGKQTKNKRERLVGEKSSHGEIYSLHILCIIYIGMARKGLSINVINALAVRLMKRKRFNSDESSRSRSNQKSIYTKEKKTFVRLFGSPGFLLQINDRHTGFGFHSSNVCRYIYIYIYRTGSVIKRYILLALLSLNSSSAAVLYIRRIYSFSLCFIFFLFSSFLFYPSFIPSFSFRLS